MIKVVAAAILFFALVSNLDFHQKTRFSYLVNSPQQKSCSFPECFVKAATKL
jgi:hypothetical protein